MQEKISQSTSTLSVALLLTDLEDVKEISLVFRKLGVIPHFYEDLKTFWQGVLERTPSLSIVDVKKMSEGDLILKNHPAVMNEELPLIFFYNDKTAPLLVSTQELFHLGTVKQSLSYEGIFKALLKRINKVKTLEEENQRLKIDLYGKSEELKLLEEEKNKILQVDYYQNLIKRVCEKLDEYKDKFEFFTSIEKLIEETVEFDTYSFVELSFNAQKLHSPTSMCSKYRALPALWLGQVCKMGIEPFAQNMAAQVALDVLGGNLISLQIKGERGHIEKMLFVKAKDDLCFQHFDWTFFESYLSGVFASVKLKESGSAKEGKHFSSTFHALSVIDQSNSPYDYLFKVDFSTLVDHLLRDGTQKFFWKKFKDDFVIKLELQCRIDFQCFENGADELLFYIRLPEVDYFLALLKEHAQKFLYWKYFENMDNALFSQVIPKVMMIPTSAYGVLSNHRAKKEISSARTFL